MGSSAKWEGVGWGVVEGCGVLMGEMGSSGRVWGADG